MYGWYTCYMLHQVVFMVLTPPDDSECTWHRRICKNISKWKISPINLHKSMFSEIEYVRRIRRHVLYISLHILFYFIFLPTNIIKFLATLIEIYQIYFNPKCWMPINLHTTPLFYILLPGSERKINRLTLYDICSKLFNKIFKYS